MLEETGTKNHDTRGKEGINNEAKKVEVCQNVLDRDNRKGQ